MSEWSKKTLHIDLISNNRILGGKLLNSKKVNKKNNVGHAVLMTAFT